MKKESGKLLTKHNNTFSKSRKSLQTHEDTSFRLNICFALYSSMRRLELGNNENDIEFSS